MLYNNTPNNSELGKKSEYDCNYNPDKLFAISRLNKRLEIGIDNNNLPFTGYDCWNHYEVSWLNTKGKPIVATAQIYYDCASVNIIESKSLKLYFNSFNNTKFANIIDLENLIKKDLTKAVGSEVMVKITELIADNILNNISTSFSGENIDYLDIECTEYTVNAEYLILDNIDNKDNQEISEVLYSDLLKSNCLVTNQPDWGSVQIAYTGKKIDKAGLLKYLISFRNHNEFHEQCIERIFVDIIKYCKPSELTVYGRYTRRGGLDINPYRTNRTNKINKKSDLNLNNIRLIRQ